MIPNLLILLKLNSWYKWEVITSGNISPISSTICLRSVDGCLIHLIRKCIYIEPMKTHTDERNLEMLVLSSNCLNNRSPEPSHQAQIRNPRSAESDHLTIDLYSKQTQSSIPFTFFSPFPHTLPPLILKWQYWCSFYVLKNNILSMLGAVWS